MPISVLPGSKEPSVSNPPVVPNIANLKKKRISWKNIIIGVVVGTILVAAGLGGWFWYQLDQINKESSNSSTQTTNKTATSSSKVSTPSATTNETAGWKTYTDRTYKFSFKTPQNWVTKEVNPIIGTLNLTVTSPNGFVLYLSLIGGTGGGCGPEDEPAFTNFYYNRYINAIKAAWFNDLGGNAVEIVERALSGAKFVSYGNSFTRKEVFIQPADKNMKIGDNGKECMPLYSEFSRGSFLEVNYRNGELMNLSFGGQYPDNSKYQQMSLNDYFNLADVKTAEKIMSSLKL